MLGSHSKKFIFFHLYKVAGTSLRDILNSYNEFSMNKHARPNQFLTTHGRDLYDEYFTFAFVRNPWDWQVSLYFYMLRDSSHPQHNLIKSFNGDFYQYIDWRINHDLVTQKQWISENYNSRSPITLDFVGKFEHLNSDFNFIMNKLGISNKLRHLNKTIHKDYREYYTDETKNMIYDAFVEDIEYFGYDFDNNNVISGEDEYNKIRLLK